MKPPLSEPEVELVDELPEGWGQSTTGPHGFAAAGGDELLAPTAVVMKVDAPADLQLVGKRYRDHTDELGVTYGDQRRVEMLGEPDALLVEGRGRAGGQGYVLHRAFIDVDGDLYTAVISMTDADAETFVPQALELLRDDVRVAT